MADLESRSRRAVMPPRTPGQPRLAGPERVVYRAMMVRTTIGPWVAGAALLAAVGCDIVSGEASTTRFGHRFRDGRRAGIVDLDADWQGTLEWTDPHDLDAVLRIDDGVYAEVFMASAVFPEDVVVYSIPGGERAGVWIARMPER